MNRGGTFFVPNGRSHVRQHRPTRRRRKEREAQLQAESEAIAAVYALPAAVQQPPPSASPPPRRRGRDAERRKNAALVPLVNVSSAPKGRETGKDSDRGGRLDPYLSTYVTVPPPSVYPLKLPQTGRRARRQWVTESLDLLSEGGSLPVSPLATAGAAAAGVSAGSPRQQPRSAPDAAAGDARVGALAMLTDDGGVSRQLLVVAERQFRLAAERRCSGGGASPADRRSPRQSHRQSRAEQSPPQTVLLKNRPGVDERGAHPCTAHRFGRAVRTAEGEPLELDSGSASGLSAAGAERPRSRPPEAVPYLQLFRDGILGRCQVDAPGRPDMSRY